MLFSYFYVVVGSCLRVVMNSIYYTLTTPYTCMERSWTYFLSVVIEQHFENVHFDWLNGAWLKKLKHSEKHLIIILYPSSLSHNNHLKLFVVNLLNYSMETRRRKGGMVPRRRNLRDQTSLVNFGVLISKIDVIRAKSGNFSLVFKFETSFSCNFLSQLKCNKKYFFVTVLPSQQLRITLNLKKGCLQNCLGFEST